MPQGKILPRVLPSPSSSIRGNFCDRTMTWTESKDAGKRAFSENKFSEALDHYSAAIDQLSSSSLSSSEGAQRRDEGSRGGGGGGRGGSASEHHQQLSILLSNVVACRLKIGGTDMVEKAVEDAKKCVSLNNQWSKAHVRLASAYIKLGGHSNDACLSLQRALSLDRTNTVAREMLVREMRRRNNQERSGESGGSSYNANNEGRQEDRGNGTPSSSQSNGGAHHHPTEETPHQSSPAPSAPHNDGIDVDDIDPPLSYHSLSISQRVQYKISRMLVWYHSQSDDIQTLFKVACCLLILYLALGGRFGLDYAFGGGAKRQRHRGNYGEGNAYNRYSSSRGPGSSSSKSNRYSSSSSDYYQDDRGNDKFHQQARNSHDTYDRQRRTSSTEYNDRSKPQNDRFYSRYGDNDDYYEPRARRRSGTNFQMPSLYDGTLVSLAILLIGGMICHRFGINPVQALMILNLLQRRGGGGRFGYGAYQGGGGGFGFGLGRQRYGFGRRGRGGYY
ncbi:hypothetical protein ACHAW5_004015 [Stephanodiscus triporus]|uniref:Uncharacterized protein n=1 Tax=Stephanodiscus triporus TaxID=2934178 RepID=A0ABD3PDK3_9STRA